MTDSLEDPFAASGHVIVCGLHDEGLRVVEQLRRAGVGAVVVDNAPDAHLVGELTQMRVPYFAGDASEPETLRTAGIETAKAIVCVESDDLQTLATALQARTLQPSIRIVAQLRNAPVGSALAEIGVKVFDAAAIASPAIAEACLGIDRRTLRLGDHELVLAQAPCTRPGTLRSLFGDLAPVGVIGADSARVEVSPGRDFEVRTGDTAALLGTEDQIKAAGLSPRSVSGIATHMVGARAARPQRDPKPSILLGFFSLVDSRVRRALLALFVLTVSSVAILMVGYRESSGRHMSPLDALYFTVETISTTGFGDFSFRDQEAWLRLWAIALMALGAVATTVFFALLTNLLIGRTIAQALGQRNLTGLRNHVVVVGAGSIGIGVVRMVRSFGERVVVIDTDAENRFIPQLISENIPHIVGDATLPETLQEARLDTARAIAVVTSDDLANLETGLTVRAQLGKRWSEVPVVLRLFDLGLAETVESNFDFRFIRSPAALAAPWFVGAAIGFDVLQTFYVGDLPMLVAKFKAEGLIVNRSMIEVSARVRVVLLERADGEVVTLPRRHATFAAGDSVYVIGTHHEILDLVREFELA